MYGGILKLISSITLVASAQVTLFIAILLLLVLTAYCVWCRRRASSTVVAKLSRRGAAYQSHSVEENGYRSLLQATGTIGWCSSAAGEFELEQPQWAEFTGQKFEQYRGWGWLNAVHPEDRASTEDGWKNAIVEDSPYEFEHRVRRQDGEYRIWRSAPFRFLMLTAR